MLSKKVIIATVAFIFILGSVLFFVSYQGPPQTKVLFSKNALNVAVATTKAEQEKGLSGVKTLPENSGMLFIFKEPIEPNFYMKDMLFSIDIIWINDKKEVIGYVENFIPETYPATTSPDEPILYAIETNAGYVQKHNITVGEKIIIK